MRIVSVTGGKGGTGKSFIATNLAWIISHRWNTVLADVDVEAPNDHILLGLRDFDTTEPIKIFYPLIDYEKCTSCGACAKVCDTGAIMMPPGRPPFILPRLCSGCKACLMVCPYDAIEEGKRIIGYIREAKVKERLTLVQGILREGEEHTPPAVVAVKRRAMSLPSDILFVDTGAGTGNTISIALQYSRVVLAVTEPTPLGLHDLEAILTVTSGMGLETWVVINKHGLAPEEEHIKKSKEYGVDTFFKVPMSRDAVDSYVRGIPVIEAFPDSPVSRELYNLAQYLVEGVLS